MDWETAETLLNENLLPKNVKKGSGGNGPKGDYIEGWHAMAEANRIFGFGEWSYSLKNLKLIGDGQNAKGTDFAKYLAVVEVIVGDASREDVGYGTGYGMDAHEGASKEAVTDALKRALRSFGNQFGLALYDKKQENVGPNDPPKPELSEEDKAKARFDAASKFAEKIRSCEDSIAVGLLIGEEATAKVIKKFHDTDKDAFKIIQDAASEFDVVINGAQGVEFHA